jgi:hypothetical protein
LWILGVEPAKKMSGRVLAEALAAPDPALQPSPPAVHHSESAWKGDGFVWHQYLDSSEVNGVIYFDQGNGAQTRP